MNEVEIMRVNETDECPDDMTELTCAACKTVYFTKGIATGGDYFCPVCRAAAEDAINDTITKATTTK